MGTKLTGHSVRTRALRNDTAERDDISAEIRFQLEQLNTVR